MRAVAGLLHHIGVLTCEDEKDFEVTYDTALGLLPSIREGQDKAGGRVRNVVVYAISRS